MPETIARPSVASLPVEVRAAGALLSTATAFIVKRNRRTVLVTNWHVVSGRRPDTGRLLSATGAIPDELVVIHNQAGALGSWIPKTQPLYKKDEKPRWLEHPRFGRSVDVVALPVTDRKDIDIYPHDPWATGPGLAVGVADRLSIIGFPFGITGGGALGIWVQGTVATEPSLDFNDRPCFLIDSRTRPGQSGSPVIAYYAGGAVPMADGSTAIMGGPVEQFLGVYSGRISEESDLGFVWKSAAVREIVEVGVPGSS